MEENKFIIYFNPNINIEVREKDHKNELGFLLVKNTPEYNSFPERHDLALLSEIKKG